MTRGLAAALAAAMLLTACGSAAVLQSKPAKVPAGIDFSGDWVLTGSSGTGRREARELLVHVFLETGKSLKITQTESGLFLNFDRSVVEEFRFGENDSISVGAVSATRVSGWEGTTYVVETLDEEGAKLTDSYRLKNDNRRLQRTIEIWKRNERTMALVQEYSQVSSGK